ncbi:hypothetical protein JCM11641_007716 [Rhodosporidiobolus odoratus]
MATLPHFSIPALPSETPLGRPSAASWLPPAHSQPSRLPTQPPSAITFHDVATWTTLHPADRLRPPVGNDRIMDKATLHSYRPPQHPASRLLHSIPPRAPSRSSRSNILSYTVDLALSSRLSTYSCPTGSRSLLYLAEAELEAGDTAVQVENAWFEAEEKTQGLWKLGVNLLQSARTAAADADGEGAVPLSQALERRVDLASLAEDLLVSPSAERAVTKIDSDSTQPSSEVEELLALKPLTAPDPTMLYHTTSTSSTFTGETSASGSSSATLATDSSMQAGPSDSTSSRSIAQSLIDLKFGGSAADRPAPTLGADSSSSSISLNDDLCEIPSASSSHLPHMDYRIVLSRSMRSRARTIFAVSPLPSITSAYCRSHRVEECAVCERMVERTEERMGQWARRRRENVPGAGLAVAAGAGGAAGGAGAKKPLANLVPAFLKLSAGLLRDVREKLNQADQDGGEGEKEGGVDEALFSSLWFTESPSLPSLATSSSSSTTTTSTTRSSEESRSTARQPRHLQVTAEWYDLFSLLLTQACLEGYLVDGWTGTEGIEVLFGVGCGVWEGRGWSLGLGAVKERKGERREEGVEGSEERAEERRRLVDAARELFGSRDVAQADFERGMRDRTHEFLNVLTSTSLHEHLAALSRKYPLSQMEDAVVDFLEASVKLMGKPALTKYTPLSSATSTSPSSTPSQPSSPSSPDPYALSRYFTPAAAPTPRTHSPPPPPPRRSQSQSQPQFQPQSRSPAAVPVSVPVKIEEEEMERRRPHRPWEEEEGDGKVIVKADEGKRRKIRLSE